MSSSVALSNSPVFSPSPSLLTQLKVAVSNSPSSSSSPSSPCSPFRLRLRNPPPPPAAPSSSAVLKMKRPTRLDIPASNMGFGAPATPAADLSEIEREGLGYSVYCKRGRRQLMEDRFSAVPQLNRDSKQGFFGIFDGHGGHKAAEFASQNLDKNIVDEISRRTEDEEQIKDAVKHGYLNTDAQFLNQNFRGGSCCVTALFRNGNLVVSNVGDCRGVISVNGVSEALTSDHRPSREDEKNRIETSGGYVDLIHGVWRIQGSLAVSRAIGDPHLKQWVIAEPETQILSLKPDYEFLILASDGLWDKVGNQEAVDIARPMCRVDKPDLLSACKKLVDVSVGRGSTDDISVMLIQMDRYI